MIAGGVRRDHERKSAHGDSHAPASRSANSPTFLCFCPSRMSCACKQISAAPGYKNVSCWPIMMTRLLTKSRNRLAAHNIRESSHGKGLRLSLAMVLYAVKRGFELRLMIEAAETRSRADGSTSLPRLNRLVSRVKECPQQPRMLQCTAESRRAPDVCVSTRPRCDAMTAGCLYGCKH